MQATKRYLPAVLVLLGLVMLANSQTCKPYAVSLTLGELYWNGNFQYCYTGGTYSNCSQYSRAIITYQTDGVCNGTKVDVMYENNATKSMTPTVDANFSDTANKYTTWTHQIKLMDVTIGYKYVYSVIGPGGTVGPFTFTLPDPYIKDDADANAKEFSFAFLGSWDAGKNGNVTTTALKELISEPYEFDMIAFTGNMAFDLQDNNGATGDAFLTGIQEISAHWPFMIAPGSHEKYNNYAYLNFRRKMPQFDSTANQYYFFNVAGAHFVYFNLLYWNNTNSATQDSMLKWLDADLQAANSKDARKERPWVIFVSNAPIYCSDLSLSACTNGYAWYKYIEKKLADNKVDLVLSGYMNNYERLKPIANNKTALFVGLEGYGDKDLHYYVDVSGPTYIVDGSAGNDNYFKASTYNLSEFSATNDFSIGYSVCTVFNSTHLRVEHYESNTTRLIDYVYIIRRSWFSTLEKALIIIIAAAAGGVILLCCIIGCIIYCCCKKKKKDGHVELKEEKE